jgi:outer membrane protein OmpA-like peptidoglycan-associated protein
MKKIILSVAFLALTTSSFAQGLEKSYFGAKIGANSSSIVSDEEKYAGLYVSNKLAFAGGLFYNYGITDQFSIQPEVLYSGMGANLAVNEAGDNDADFCLNYISVPVLFKYSPMWRLGLFVGPQFDFLIDSKLKDSSTDEEIDVDVDSFDFAGTAGLEFWITKNIGVYGRYSLGFIDLNTKDKDLDDDFENEFTNEAIQFGVIFALRDKIAPAPAPKAVAAAPVAAPKPVDTDGDGIADAQDKCPKVAGPRENGGCPWPDTDGDGTLDKDDKCPKMAGLAANYGCPDLTIYYLRDEKDLTGDDKAQLDKVVTFLNTYPTLNIELQGHTSALGADDYNMKLSEKRATQAKDYIVSKGISADRMTTKAFGETQTIGDQETEEGRAKSRRTTIKIAN